MVDDKRTRHTKERIRNAMLTCLETTTLDRITVMQICKVADINRSTFYAHYANPQELYQYLEKCMTDGMKRLFQDLKNQDGLI
ncbi:TetR/AcrR family transcriptional regulator [Ruminococcus sp.]|uniref:TetR/AcrR family transcriptional regulator n=1 Tax=Ruminococcus sp. TaxID=41978 RepID=UPI0038650C4E